MKGHFLLFVFVFAKIALSEKCNEEIQRRCKQEALAAIEFGNCTALRDSFNCLVLQSSNCPDPVVKEALVPSLRQIHAHLKNNSDCVADYESSNWCYSKNDLKSCSYQNNPRGLCSTYDKFRSCVTHIVNTECLPSSMAMLFTYLTDKGGENEWKCPKYGFGPIETSSNMFLSKLPGCSDTHLAKCITDSSPAIESNNCTSVRELFNCILWQSTRCLTNEEKDSVKPTFIRLWNHLENFCGGEESWKDDFCYKKWDLKKCERKNKPMTSCSSFFKFKQCVKTLLFADCFERDRRLMPTYLTHKGKENAWNCPNFGMVPVVAQRTLPGGTFVVL